MTTLTTKHQRLAALRPLSPESVASLAAAWDVRMVYECNSIEGNSLTLRETEIVLSKGVTVSGKPPTPAISKPGKISSPLSFIKNSTSGSPPSIQPLP